MKRSERSTRWVDRLVRDGSEKEKRERGKGKEQRRSSRVACKNYKRKGMDHGGTEDTEKMKR